jgi:hypothetical protein
VALWVVLGPDFGMTLACTQPIHAVGAIPKILNLRKLLILRTPKAYRINTILSVLLRSIHYLGEVL